MGGLAPHLVNSVCMREYVDLGTGRALLTSIPARKIGRLRREYPGMKIIPVIHAFPETFAGNL